MVFFFFFFVCVVSHCDRSAVANKLRVDRQKNGQNQPAVFRIFRPNLKKS